MAKSRETSDSKPSQQQSLPLTWDEADAAGAAEEAAPDQAEAVEEGEGSSPPPSGEDRVESAERPPLEAASVPDEEASLDEEDRPPFEPDESDDGPASGDVSPAVVPEEEFGTDPSEASGDSAGAGSGSVETLCGGDVEGGEDGPHVVQLKNAVASVGQRLMRARADAGLTISEVASRTQIRSSVIEQLENDRFDGLPVEFYCIRHVEALCREYGIEPGPVVEQFHETMEQYDGAAGEDRFSVTSFETESGSRVTYTPTSATVTGAGKRSVSITGIIVSVMIVLLAVLAIGAWAVQQWRSRSASGDGDVPVMPEARELSEFIVPQQLPLESMPIPRD